MDNKEDVGKPQEELRQEEEPQEESVDTGIPSGDVQEEKQTQVEEVEPMEEKTQVEATEEKKGGGKGLVYLALIFAIVALVLSFWNAGVQRVVKEIETQEKALEAKTQAISTALNKVQAQALLSRVQLEANRVYVLTMGEGNYEAAATVLSRMEKQINALRTYYPKDKVDELAAILDALKKEVAKGPSPIPGLVAQIQSMSDRLMAGEGGVALQETKPAEVEAKPAKEEGKAVQEEGKAVSEESKAEKKEEVIKKAPQEEKGEAAQVQPAPAKRTGPQAGMAPEEEGPFGSLLKSWNKLGEKLVGEK